MCILLGRVDVLLAMKFRKNLLEEAICDGGTQKHRTFHHLKQCKHNSTSGAKSLCDSDCASDIRNISIQSQKELCESLNPLIMPVWP